MDNGYIFSGEHNPRIILKHNDILPVIRASEFGLNDITFIILKIKFFKKAVIINHNMVIINMQMVAVVEILFFLPDKVFRNPQFFICLHLVVIYRNALKN